ncbi:MAG: hypothetical protein VX715_03445 [Planctomycetota bacterium]|nr:hypothetical protein [Planctomycetota bacterium]
MEVHPRQSLGVLSSPRRTLPRHKLPQYKLPHHKLPHHKLPQYKLPHHKLTHHKLPQYKSPLNKSPRFTCNKSKGFTLPVPTASMRWYCRLRLWDGGGVVQAARASA